jgi:hypothetical protein
MHLFDAGAGVILYFKEKNLRLQPLKHHGIPTHSFLPCLHAQVTWIL